MPTYVVTVPQGRLSSKQKMQLGVEITQVHCDITGAPSYFAQVIINEVLDRNYFVGGKPLQGTDHIWLHGIIRARREAAVKERMLVELMKVVSKISEVDEHNVQVYISEILARQVLEFGKILPNPGEEQQWFESIPVNLRTRILADQFGYNESTLEE